MKKLGIVILFLFMFVGLVGFVNAVCTDSDNGINYYSKANAQDNNQTFNDECVVNNPKQLSESYCENEIAKSVKYDCPNGCSDGVCLCPTTNCNNGIIYGPEKCSIENNVCVCPACPVPPIITQCYSNADCPSVKGAQYCKNEQELCGTVATYSCVNGQCISSGGGLGCKVCPDGCSDGACINIENKIEEIKEQVKCVFDGSTQLQKCYTAGDNLRAYCSGNETCITDISGYKGEKITWKSTCGGYDYTIIDGVNNNVDFDCKNIGICQSSKCDDGTIPECKINNGQCICQTCPPIIIKPVCGNGICESGEGEICSAVAMLCEVSKECVSPPSTCEVVCPQDCKPLEPLYINLNEKFKLSVYQPAKIMENGNAVMKISFKDLILSQCGEIPVSSEVATTIESRVAIATGMVIASTETTETTTTTTPSTSSGGGGTVSASPSSGGGGGTTSIIKCDATTMPIALLRIDIISSQISTGTILNLNVGEKKQVDKFTVAFLGYDYASRTGTFLVNREKFSCPVNCKCDENGKTIECAEKCEKGKTLCSDGKCKEKCEITTEDCKYGCSYEGKCFPMGVRSSGMFCSVDSIMSSQLKENEKCENNFECSSNVCVSGNCISEGLINRILSWFKRILG